MNNLDQKYLKLEKRLERALGNGRFMQFSRKKQAQLARRLKGISLQLKRSLKPAIATAFLTLGLLGSANAQITFTQQTTHPLSTLSGDLLATSFVDIDNDGDYDCFIGNYDGSVDFYLNTGSATVATFQLQSAANNPMDGIDVGNNARVGFIDLDGDGDMDCFIGDFDGVFEYYQNTGSASLATFTAQTGANNPLNGIDVGFNGIARFFDIDNDGDKDAILADYSGSIRYFQNSSGVFTEQTGTSNPFNSIVIGAGNKEFDFADLDEDGDLDLFMTYNNAGNYEVRYYRNDGSAGTPGFGVEVQGTLNPFNGMGDIMRWLRFVDIDGDGDMDCFGNEIVSTLIEINFFRNDSPVAITPLEQKNLTLYPNPATSSVNFNQAQTGSLELYNNLGQLIHSEILTQELNWNIPSDLNNGLYQLILRTEEAIWTNKVQIQR
jgi:hypothetical protein